MIVPALIGWTHEDCVFTYKDAGQIHCLVDAIGRAIRLETVDADFGRRVQVPTRLRPKWLDVAVVAFRFSTEELVSSCRCSDVKINAGLWRRSGNSELIEVQLRQLLRYAILLR